MVPVSYTHLVWVVALVGKNSSHHTLHIVEALLVLAYCGHLKIDEPVSYTHLDVYKRQLNTYPGTWRQEGGASAKGNIIDEEYKEGIYVGYRWTDKERIKPTLSLIHISQAL